jgi:ribosome-associated heat shock protein Hsp15
MDQVRIDKWLWAARFFKTRSLAADAIDMGRIEVNDERSKRSRHVAVGDRVRVRRPPFEQVVVVRALSDSRGPAAVASTLYEETAESLAGRERLAAQLKAMGAPVMGEGRPTKKDRRDTERWRGRR